MGVKTDGEKKNCTLTLHCKTKKLDDVQSGKGQDDNISHHHHFLIVFVKVPQVASDHQSAMSEKRV